MRRSNPGAKDGIVALDRRATLAMTRRSKLQYNSNYSHIKNPIKRFSSGLYGFHNN